MRDRKTGTWRAPRKRGPKGHDVAELDTPPAAPPGDVDAGLEDSWGAERDPEPARLAEEPKRPPADETPKSLKEALEDAAALLGVLEVLVLTPLSRVDPYCVGALTDNYENIVDKALPLIARSPRLLSWLSTAGGGKDWLMFAAALRPVASAVLAHHVTKTARLEEEGAPDLDQYPAAAA